MAISAAYRRELEDVYRSLLREGTPGQYDENGLPSYTHANKLMAWLFWKRIDTALDFCPDIDGKSVLDFGCGGGPTFRYLAQRGCKLVGCDEQLHLSQAVSDALGIRANLVTDLSLLAGAQFDYIFALDVLEHIVDGKEILLKFRELLKKGGRVIVSGPTENGLYRVGRRLAGFSGHYHVKNIYDIEHEFLGQGFSREAARTLVFAAPLFRVSVWRS